MGKTYPRHARPVYDVSMEQSPTHIIAALNKQSLALGEQEYAFNDRLRARYEDLSLQTIDLIETATTTACNAPIDNETDQAGKDKSQKTWREQHRPYRCDPFSAVSKSAWTHSVIERLRAHTMGRLYGFLERSRAAQYRKINNAQRKDAREADSLLSNAPSVIDPAPLSALPTAQTSAFNQDQNGTPSPTTPLDHLTDMTADVIKHLEVQAMMIDREEKALHASMGSNKPFPPERTTPKISTPERTTTPSNTGGKKDELISLQEMLEHLQRSTQEQNGSSKGDTPP